MRLGIFRQLRLPGRLTLRRRAACALLAFLAAPTPALAQASDSATADASATILTSGAMATVANMNFGVMTRPTVASMVTMTPDVAAICAASAGVIHTGACQPARFAIMGKKHDRARIRENNGGTIVLTGPGGATMTVTNLTLGGAGGWNYGRWRITTDSGMAEFGIGGRLNIAANQAEGSYSGVLNLQVQMN